MKNLYPEYLGAMQCYIGDASDALPMGYTHPQCAMRTKGIGKKKNGIVGLLVIIKREYFDAYYLTYG